MKNKALHLESDEFTQRSATEAEIDTSLRKYVDQLLPVMGGRAWNWDIQVTLKRQVFSRLIHYYELYKKIVDVQGVILEFGVQWGATLTTLNNLRGMFEPYNHARKIYGFDTFEGFATIDEKDGGFSKVGQYKVSEDYEKVLEDILNLHQGLSPIPQIKKFELIKGDASVTFPKWLDDNTHAIVAMAILDMDVYKPTKDVLEKIIPRLTKGSLLVFDELNCQHFPGETQAVAEVLGLNNLALRCFPHQPYCSWAIWEG
ncbi:MAG: crotonobetainyl-CoA--carnitine CoA-transferase [Microcystis aeruginosa LL13-06]|jgi:hypothetical protein|uniref:Crotonobetainyl-CoA--carnitine CoA-transferase n=1 Tax=Microcystis aeruginosa G11-04 TaxID=2685956 RepID=A0A966FW59_MICAE|nr:crotonobetainyl-CoA--carnitine CoA-transferase [Microcystis aeruginosa SX13-11]NCR56538.1 crotonobetainyl-CoA--carnitine CoA-transferase [Microcystis aeruginosa LL13-06]NCR66594.1 crotonobetainyl-CoA--carnitine CoA-transferase [Microcystis aeruginosa LL11-07]NCS55798.1 crotonobetainyl-CoA--carnitine CoA-transferase [Microcystis aeruginosa G11-04]